MTMFWIGLIATVVVGLGTFLMRSVFVLALAERPFPPAVRQALRFVAPSVMAALVISLGFGGSEPAGWVEAVALAVSGLVGWRTRSLAWVLVAGMATLWLLRAVT